MSDDFREFNIRQAPNRLWRIVQYFGGRGPKPLQGYFLTFQQAEDTLIHYLKRYNKGFARYPGCPKPRPTNYIAHLLKDWSPKPAP